MVYKKFRHLIFDKMEILCKVIGEFGTRNNSNFAQKNVMAYIYKNVMFENITFYGMA